VRACSSSSPHVERQSGIYTDGLKSERHKNEDADGARPRQPRAIVAASWVSNNLPNG